MDNNLNQPVSPNLQEVPNPVVQPVTPSPVQTLPPVMPSSVTLPQNKGSKAKIALVLVVILLVLGVLGFVAFSYFNSAKTYNAGVYNYPTQAPITPTPTGVVNPNDTTDSAIDSDSKVVDQQLNNLNSDINGVDQSLNDKQTNL